MTAASLRLTRWLGGPPKVMSADEPAAPARLSAQRTLYADIGDFLFTHQLALSDRNFGVVRAYFEGHPEIVARITALLRDTAGLTDAALAELAEARPNPLAPERLAEMADTLNERLFECLKIVGQSSVSAREYGAAINCEVQGFGEDPMGTFERLLATTRDVVEATLGMEAQLDKTRKETERLRSHLTRARREADHDHLTGLLNRRSFEARLSALPVEMDGGGPACVALCDIDRFKAINDEYGHHTGDRMLRYFARRLRDALADHAVVARYGGEEFVCLFEATPLPEAVALLDAIREGFATKSLINQQTGQTMQPITFSAGMAAIEGDRREALFAADRALYDAKRSGRNRLIVSAKPIAA